MTMKYNMQLAVQVSLLKRSRDIDRYSLCVTIFALLQLALQSYLPHSLPLWQLLLIVVLLLGVGQQYYMMRVKLDTDLFSQLLTQVNHCDDNIEDKSIESHLTALDHALAEQSLISPATRVRPLKERCLGATRLLKRQLLCYIVQLFLFIAVVLNYSYPLLFTPGR